MVKSQKTAEGTTDAFCYSGNDETSCITRSEAAADLRVSLRTFDKLLPQIPHFLVGRRILIRRSELRRWLEQYRVAPNDLGLCQLADDVVTAVLGSNQNAKEKE